jgi:HSP20 family protein
MLMRYDPFRELDRHTDQLFGSGGRQAWVPMDAVRTKEGVELRFDVPGVAPDSIDVSVERNVLTIKAERSWFLGEGEESLAKERPQGSFVRQVFLGEALDVDRLDAAYEHGVLTVVIPVAEQAKPRKVQIRVGESQPLEVGASA